MPNKINIAQLMSESRVQFGTSGVRGLVADMTDRVCYAYTLAFIQYLEKINELRGQGEIGIGGDLRPSTDRIMKASAQAVIDQGYRAENWGKLPTPAVAYAGLRKRIPTVMVTGSHIPEDRNGIKFNKAGGEILKPDEQGIKEQKVLVPENLFDQAGNLVHSVSLPAADNQPTEWYVNRYLEYFPGGCLFGKTIGVYQHSAVGRDLIARILSNLGANVVPLGFAKQFVSVDTEAIRPEEIELARSWAKQYNLDAIVSSDGDSDRPLVADENGRWLRGDIAGILCARYLGADIVVTPVSSNTAVEKCGWFKKVLRTRIGSPFVIEAMQRISQQGGVQRVVGYEANGGFLLGSQLESSGKTLRPLPTRDALIVHLGVLLLSLETRQPISRLCAELPQRFTYSDRLKNFPIEKSQAILSRLYSGHPAKDNQVLQEFLGQRFGEIQKLDTTDGLRITFASQEIVHLRPSGNAPEFRCYTEADSESRAMEINRICLEMIVKQAW